MGCGEPGLPRLWPGANKRHIEMFRMFLTVWKDMSNEQKELAAAEKACVLRAHPCTPLAPFVTKCERT